jgi:predicted porin
MKRSIAVITSAMAVVASMSAMSAAKADELGDLKAQLLKRVNDLEAELAQLRAQVNKANAAPAAPPTATMAAPAPVVALPESLASDQQGRPYSDMNPDGISVFDNHKTRMSVYGIVEATLSRVSEQAVSPIPFGSGKNPQSTPAGSTPSGTYATTFGFQTAWFSGNRLGFDFQHDLGDFAGMHGLKAMVKLENEFELPSGSFDTSNTIFNRDAWLGFYSPELGKITFGRQNTLTRDFTQSWGDPYGTAAVTLKEGGWTNVNNFKQLIFYSGSGDSTRMDSAVVWKKAFGDNWIVGLAHSFGFQGAGGSGGLGPGELYGSITPGYSGGGQGGPVPGDSRNGATNEASVAYNGLRLADGVVANGNYSFNTVNVDDLNQTSHQVGGNIIFNNMVRVNGGYVHYTAEQGLSNSAGTRTDKAYTLSSSLLVNRTDYTLGYQSIKVDHAGFIGGGTGGINMLPFIATAPNLSMLNAIASNVASGNKNTLYGSVVYHWDRQTDFYVAGDSCKVSGKVSFPDAANNGTNLSGDPTKGVSAETEIATGVRLKF